MQTVLRLDENLYEKIRVLAAKDHRSINNMIEVILQQYVQSCEQETKTISIEAKD